VQVAKDVHPSVMIEKYLPFNITLIFFWVINYFPLLFEGRRQEGAYAYIFVHLHHMLHSRQLSINAVGSEW